LIDVFSRAESVGPNTHLKRDLELLISKFKDLLKGILLFKADWEGNLRGDK
jgi:hypothetical protein